MYSARVPIVLGKGIHVSQRDSFLNPTSGIIISFQISLLRFQITFGSLETALETFYFLLVSEVVEI